MSQTTDQIMLYCPPMDGEKKNQQFYSLFIFETDTQPLEPNSAMTQNDIFLFILSVYLFYFFCLFCKERKKTDRTHRFLCSTPQVLKEIDLEFRCNI